MLVSSYACRKGKAWVRGKEFGISEHSFSWPVVPLDREALFAWELHWHQLWNLLKLEIEVLQKCNGSHAVKTPPGGSAMQGDKTHRLHQIEVLTALLGEGSSCGRDTAETKEFPWSYIPSPGRGDAWPQCTWFCQLKHLIPTAWSWGWTHWGSGLKNKTVIRNYLFISASAHILKVYCAWSLGLLAWSTRNTPLAQPEQSWHTKHR